MGNASAEGGFLASLDRDQLAKVWVATLKRAYGRTADLKRGRGGRWAAVGRDPRLRRVQSEFIRRRYANELADELERRRAECGHPHGDG